VSLEVAINPAQAGDIRGSEALDTLHPSRTVLPLFSCGIVVLVVVVASASPTHGGINDNGGKSKGVQFEVWDGIENCLFIFWTLAIWASI
jgi:hypothetical protein